MYRNRWVWAAGAVVLLLLALAFWPAIRNGLHKYAQSRGDQVVQTDDASASGEHQPTQLDRIEKKVDGLKEYADPTYKQAAKAASLADAVDTKVDRIDKKVGEPSPDHAEKTLFKAVERAGDEAKRAADCACKGDKCGKQKVVQKTEAAAPAPKAKVADSCNVLSYDAGTGSCYINERYLPSGNRCAMYGGKGPKDDPARDNHWGYYVSRKGDALPASDQVGACTNGWCQLPKLVTGIRFSVASCNLSEDSSPGEGFDPAWAQYSQCCDDKGPKDPSCYANHDEVGSFALVCDPNTTPPLRQ